MRPLHAGAKSLSVRRFLHALGFEGHSFHSLRATQATNVSAKGATIDEIAMALGPNACDQGLH